MGKNAEDRKGTASQGALARQTPLAVGQVVDYGAMAGEGYENTSAADFSIPFLALLQANSPQIADKDQRIKGALPGMMFNTVTGELYPDDEHGLIFVPCLTEHCFTEWTPRDKGGGFQGRHATDSQAVQEAKARPSPRPGRYLTATGNELVESFYMYGMRLENVGDLEAAEILVIAFTSTKIKVYRHVMQKLRTCKQLAKAPLFAHQLRIRSFSDKNVHGSFMNFEIAPAVNGDILDSAIAPKLQDGTPNPILNTGSELVKAIFSGAARAATETAGSDRPASGDDVF